MVFNYRFSNFSHVNPVSLNTNLQIKNHCTLMIHHPRVHILSLWRRNFPPAADLAERGSGVTHCDCNFADINCYWCLLPSQSIICTLRLVWKAIVGNISVWTSSVESQERVLSSRLLFSALSFSLQSQTLGLTIQKMIAVIAQQRRWVEYFRESLKQS